MSKTFRLYVYCFDLDSELTIKSNNGFFSANFFSLSISLSLSCMCVVQRYFFYRKITHRMNGFWYLFYVYTNKRTEKKAFVSLIKECSRLDKMFGFSRRMYSSVWPPFAVIHRGRQQNSIFNSNGLYAVFLCTHKHTKSKLKKEKRNKKT